MAGSLSVTTVVFSDANIIKYTIIWASDAAGDVSGHADDLQMLRTSGTIRQIQFLPTGGPTPPTNLYDVSLVYGEIDYLDGVGSNLSGSVSTIVVPVAPLFIDNDTALDLLVVNGGDTAWGTVTLWIGL